jgi:hypothetical protein
MSERTSDQEFVRLFSPKILEKLDELAFEAGLHVFRSAPGAGKTTLLRAFTPTALKAFWQARNTVELSESYRNLVSRGVLHEEAGPEVLGVLLSCASGYADLPPGAAAANEALFRALLDCRIVLRALRSLALFLGASSTEQLESVRLEYPSDTSGFSDIPPIERVADLAKWAEQQERGVYAQLDSYADTGKTFATGHPRFSGVLWLQTVRFVANEIVVAPKRLLMIDDLHVLRRRQRSLLIDELTVLRASIPIWLAERSSALGDEFLSQGAREGRDLHECTLEEMWSGPRGTHQFMAFGQNILDRRMVMQSAIPSATFSQCLGEQLVAGEIQPLIEKGIESFRDDVRRHESNLRYSGWLNRAEQRSLEVGLESLLELYVTRILVSRDEAKRQMTLELTRLSEEEFEERDSPQVHGAAELFAHDELGIPYYFGTERLCSMATSNVEELLSLAGALFVGLQARQVLRKPELVLSPAEQEKLLKDAAKNKRDFIPKVHTEGSRAQRLLDAIGIYCRERTFLPSAPYAPGVTGLRLSQTELAYLHNPAPALAGQVAILKKVLAECAAENLLLTRPSASSTSREGGTVFYLNRTLCAHYGLPLQFGGWQDVDVKELMEWMERGLSSSRRKRLETM